MSDTTGTTKSANADQPLDLAVVGNCEVAALIDRQARIVWMCLPRPDGEPVFCALLTRELGAAAQGVFAFDLLHFARSEQRYERNTAIVETMLQDDRGGSIAVTDFCPRYRARGRMFRPMMIVRMIRPISGRPLLRIRLKPSAANGARPAQMHSGNHHVRYSTESSEFRVTSDAPISAITEGRTIVIERPIAFILGPNETVEETPASLAVSLLEETRSYWQDWVRTLNIPFDWQEAVIRAAITLKLCTYEDTGAVLAALTTSIPESPASGRTWDYRFCWLRDSYFVIQALNRLGATRTMEGYLHYIDHIVSTSDVAELRPVYPIMGEGDLKEEIVTALDGFLGMGPVRIGNQAAQQTQYDVYGAIILAATQLFFDDRLAQPGGEPLFRQLEQLGETAARVYERPDAGPWEFRGVVRAHTFSAAMSWAGCDRLSKIAVRLGLKDAAQRWRKCADQMRERIIARAWNGRSGAFVSALDGEHLDSTALLLPDLGIIDPRDPRFCSTVDAIGRELRHGDLLYRYKHLDDFGAPSSAFTVCAFWYVNALAAVGRMEEAREQFDSLLKRRSALGLLSEDIDLDTGALWGNFPQTYSLVGVITSAVRLSRPWDDAL